MTLRSSLELSREESHICHINMAKGLFRQKVCDPIFSSKHLDQEITIKCVVCIGIQTIPEMYKSIWKALKSSQTVKEVRCAVYAYQGRTKYS